MIALSLSEIKKRLDNLILPEFDFIIGIAEGGIVPASLVSYKTNIEMRLIRINFRDENNNQKHLNPIILSGLDETIKNKNILLVDDAAVTGITLEMAKSYLCDNKIKTLVFKGKADYILFPEIDTCVNWPWKIRQNN